MRQKELGMGGYPSVSSDKRCRAKIGGGVTSDELVVPHILEYAKTRT